MNSSLPLLALIGLGAYDGINPAMRWLFAPGLGLQENSRRAVLAALFPIALGHALSLQPLAETDCLKPGSMMQENGQPPELSHTIDCTGSQDYYLENGLLVMTEAYHRKRGYCC